MSRYPRVRERHIHTLERLRELELEHARVEHQILDRAVQEQRNQVLGLRQQIEANHAQEQALLQQVGGVSPAALWRIRNYSLWQFGLLAQQQARLAQTQQAAEEAHTKVVARYERLSVIRRLRVRLAREADAARVHRELITLDDLGSIISHHPREDRSMSIDAIGLPASSANLSTPSNSAISENSFLQILLTQLRYQDPLQPVNNEQFLAQLAQFSALEIAQEQNTNLKSELTMQDTAQAVSLLGKTVSATSGASTATGTVTAITFSTTGQPTLTLTASGGSGATTVGVNLSAITLIQN
jgi:flagellar basal-body rod modification protein FlgD